MKKLILIVLTVLCYGFTQGQKTIYVKSPTDKRLIAYKDSLTAWKNHEEWKQQLILKLGAVQTLSEYEKINSEEGFSVTNTPITADKKFMYKDTKKSEINREFLTCFHSMLGDIDCLYSTIVPKPIRIVYYVKPAEPPLRHHTTVVIKINAQNDTIKCVTTTQVIPTRH